MTKDRIAKGFDFLAPAYDQLARAIIGEDIIHSQVYFLKRLSSCKRLLIIGGGTGWLLQDVCKNWPHLEIDYIDLSPRMINKARMRMTDSSQVTFITGSVNDIPTRPYDGVITNFFLDMFTDKSMSSVVRAIRRALHSDSIWLVTDFVNERKTHAVKLWLMYRFFNIITKIEATKLVDWQRQVLEAGFQLSESRKFSHGFICSNVYRLSSHFMHTQS
jgi:tRNA (cmo5U34)-methyltransferase